MARFGGSRKTPGPNIATQPSPVAIGNLNTTISASDNNWADSWKGVWNTILGSNPSNLTSANSNGTSSTSSFTAPSPSAPAVTGGLQTSAKAGIAIGSIAAGEISLVALFIYLRRRKGKVTKDKLSSPLVHKKENKARELEAPQGQSELDGNGHQLNEYGTVEPL
ncbi:hypothetical protein G7Y89_g3337 [Cudoniella acicularis]|uniref:Uncharacterized protein n=1 Tax=Cudoniella acicularis TaxID=354080 RepID=A0A8H4RTF1_9HELO|nr:hypothetical protein G7Y89_g3337 [Cudoniella acicularis]